MSIAEYLQYGFIQRAIAAGAFISLLCSTLGVLLVLRRLSLIGDGLAHVTFGSVALGLLFGTYPVYVSLPVVMASSVGILKLMERARIFGDAAIGILSALGIAGGVMIASIAGGFNIDLFSYLFGNILSISVEEVYTSVILSLIVLVVIVFNYHDIFSITFDEEFAKAGGINTQKLNTMIVLFTSITVVLTMKVVGIMLTSALLIFPAVTAFQIAGSFKYSLMAAGAVSLASVMLGIMLSLFFNLPTGATIVLANAFFLTTAFIFKRVRSRGRT
ncbi:MAG TPA: metal ABC transporter permease [Dissulfurispiraceae bacterium]|nr:metal ABC transporter permease [Dissulfurispiraceae bacterium]